MKKNEIVDELHGKSVKFNSNAQAKYLPNLLNTEMHEIQRLPSLLVDNPLRPHCVKYVQIRNFFWSVLSCIWTEYRDLLHKSPYSIQIQKNTDQKKLRIWALFTQYLGRSWFSTVTNHCMTSLITHKTYKINC